MSQCPKQCLAHSKLKDLGVSQRSWNLPASLLSPDSPHSGWRSESWLFSGAWGNSPGETSIKVGGTWLETSGFQSEVKVTGSHLTLCNLMDCTVPGILQARILEWVAMPSSRGSSVPGIEPRSPALQAETLLSEPPGKPISRDTGSQTPATGP